MSGQRMQTDRASGIILPEGTPEVGSAPRVVVFDYCLSAVVLTWRRTSRPIHLRPGQWAWWRGLPYTLVSLLLGWWGLPWGVVGTLFAVLTNCAGGREVTLEVRQEPGS